MIKNKNIKNKKLPLFLSKITSNNAVDYSSSWAWPAPYCQQPRTLSFRTTGDSNLKDNSIIINNNNNMFKTLNSVYNSDDTPPNSDSESSPPPPGGGENEKSVESVISELRSVDNRLSFKPCGTSSNILEEANHKEAKSSSGEISYNNCAKMLKESAVMVSMDSQDPYLDFKKSMEEMVEAQGLKDWASLEDLLCCYLKVNGKNNHAYIIGAFVDLLVNLAFNSSYSSSSSATTTVISSSSYSPSSPLSFYTSSNFSDDSSSTPCISSSLLEDDDEEEVENEIKEIN